MVIYINYPNIYAYAKDLLYKTFDAHSLEIFSNGFLIDESDVNSLEDSGITGETLEFDTSFYPYFELLNTNEQKLYKQIYANAENLKTTFVPIVTVTSSKLSKIIESVYNDHPELFWLNTKYSYKYTKDGNCVQIILSYNSTINNLSYHKYMFESSANKIINEANELSTNYEKEKYVHDALIKLIDYDTNAPLNQSAYSALVNHKTVCAGYTRSFQYIMIKLGIPTYYVTGTSKNTDHAWNIIKLSDGYYNVDLTWDDQTSIIYYFFNISDKDFSKTHTRRGLSKSLPSCNGTTYSSLEKKSNNANQTIRNNNSKESKDTEEFIIQDKNSYLIDLPDSDNLPTITINNDIFNFKKGNIIYYTNSNL